MSTKIYSTTVLQRLEAKTHRTPSGCWEWTGPRIPSGYGYIYVGGPRPGNRGMSVHRAAHLLLIGPIPDGLDVDHLCRNRPCWNPAHLEAVDTRTNFLRSGHLTAVSVRSNICWRGHELTPANTYVEKNGKRHCQICRRAAEARARPPRPRVLKTEAELRATQKAWELRNRQRLYALRRARYHANPEESRRKQREYLARRRAA